MGWLHILINVFPDLPSTWHRILKPTALASLASRTAVTLKCGTAFGRYQNSVIWPHELFAGLWQHHHQAFPKVVMGGGPDSIRQFWEEMPPRPGMEGRVGWKDRCIPISLHGDGVAVANIRGKGSKVVDCLSWSSLLSTGPTRLTNFLVWFAFNHLAKKNGFAATWPTFWRQLCKSLRSLWEGTWPMTDQNGDPHPLAGQPLAGGYYCVVYTKKGDLPWIASNLGLSHSSSTQPCMMCKCTNLGGEQDRMPWTDCNQPPSWLPSCWTDEVKPAMGFWGA